MLDQHNKILQEYIWQMIDKGIRESESSNEELREYQHALYQINGDFERIFSNLNKEDREVVDEYLTIQNNMDCLIQYDLYRKGIQDGIQLIKELKVI